MHNIRFSHSVGPDALIGPLDGSFRRGFRRLRAASSFAHGGKGTKTPPGTRPMGYGFTLFRLDP